MVLGPMFIIRTAEENFLLFEKIFPEHVQYLGQIFNQLSQKDLMHMNHSLKVLREAFEKQSEQ